MGKPIIKGTRITVELILTKLAEGENEAELLEDYPHLAQADIRAAMAYGAASVSPQKEDSRGFYPAPVDPTKR